MTYDNLTPEQQQQIRDNTVSSLEQQHYATTLSIAMAESCGQETSHFEQQLEDLEKQKAALLDES